MLITDKTDKVNTGLTANITLPVKSKGNALIIPRQAVLQKNNRYFVMIDKGNGIEEEKNVTLGLQDQNNFVEVLSGLDADNTVYSY
jgi:hypothetical protein